MKIRETLNSLKTTRISIVGSSASGKSSIINILLGETVVPYHHSIYCPCTIMYGAERKAMLYFKDDILPNERKNLPIVIKENSQTEGTSHIPPLRITIDELKENTASDFQGDCYLCPPYSKIEINIPSNFLKNKLEITEWPWLDNPFEHSRLCVKHLCADDIVIMTLNACALISMDEMNFIEYVLNAQGITPVFVITRADLMTDVEKVSIIKYAKHHLSSYSPYDILLVSTAQAIKGLKENDETLFEKSNIESLKVLLSSIIQQ